MSSIMRNFCPKQHGGYTWVLYIVIVIFIVTAVSNGANMTDGLDGLATGVSAIIGICLVYLRMPVATCVLPII